MYTLAWNGAMGVDLNTHLGVYCMHFGVDLVWIRMHSAVFSTVDLVWLGIDMEILFVWCDWVRCGLVVVLYRYQHIGKHFKMLSLLHKI